MGMPEKGGAAEDALIRLGESLFQTTFTPQQGRGPLFNGRSSPNVADFQTRRRRSRRARPGVPASRAAASSVGGRVK